MDDQEFSQLLKFLGLSWQGYRQVRKGAKKRVGRHMQRLGCSGMQEYLHQLEQRAETRSQCELALAVPISRFFRDRPLWHALQEQILPALIAAGRDSVRVWSAGCAGGEEVFSLKIIWEQLRRSHGPLAILEITATDLHPVHLERANAAVYSASSLREAPENTKSTWFEMQPDGRRFRVKPTLQEGIVWRRHDFLSAPPVSNLDLILARNNLLTYYHSSRIRAPLEEIANALSVGGYLIIGSHEKLPCPPSDLQLRPLLPLVFQKVG